MVEVRSKDSSRSNIGGSSLENAFVRESDLSETRYPSKEPQCPECGSEKIFKAGFRYLATDAEIQRYSCRSCFHRFSEQNEQVNVRRKVVIVSQPETDHLKKRVTKTNLAVQEGMDSVSLGGSENSGVHKVTEAGKILYTFRNYNSNGQVCAQQEAKNLDTQTEIKTVCAGDEKNLVTYAWLLKRKRGNADNTIELRVRTLKLMQRKGVDLNNPETLENALATEPLTAARKRIWVSCYTSYVKTMNIPWEPTRVKYEPKEPFLPTHEETNALIFAASKKLATLLQVALTTGARIGEICKLQWTDINTEKSAISINDAEKGSRNRTVKVPEKTIAMLNALPKKNTPYVFNTKPVNVRAIFSNLRRRLATVQNNPRFLQIHLHTFRHFYATEALRNTKNLSYVKYVLGHKSIMNTERYTHIVDFDTGKYYSAVAKTLEEGIKLAEDGWTYFQEFDGVKVFRKPRY
jgi:integrase/transposase-like protein